ncbi:MAG: hypothetical protein KF776_19095, partial [Burkholderiales bacterium]|nr:hypothetical protein [Burkholderiales bacterium]
MILLFLDFDGVLHGSPGLFGDLDQRWVRFRYLPELTEVLSDFKEVEIVISSSWRYRESLAQLKRDVGKLGRRVTPGGHPNSRT